MKFVKVFLFTLLVAGVFSFPEEAFGTSPDVNLMDPTDNKNVFWDAETSQYFDSRDGGYIGEVFQINVDGTFTEVDVAEYITSEAEPDFFYGQEIPPTKPPYPPAEPTIAQPKPQDGPYSTAYYYEETNYEVRFFGDPASLPQENFGPGTDTETIAYQETKSYSVSTGLDSIELSALKIGAGFSFNYSESISSSHTLSIPPGYQAYWRFDPVMNYTRGTMKTYYNGYLQSSREVSSYSPVKFNGHLKGYLVSVKTPIPEGN